MTDSMCLFRVRTIHHLFSNDSMTNRPSPQKVTEGGFPILIYTSPMVARKGLQADFWGS